MTLQQTKDSDGGQIDMRRTSHFEEFNCAKGVVPCDSACHPQRGIAIPHEVIDVGEQIDDDEQPVRRDEKNNEGVNQPVQQISVESSQQEESGRMWRESEEIDTVTS